MRIEYNVQTGITTEHESLPPTPLTQEQQDDIAFNEWVVEQAATKEAALREEFNQAKGI